VVLEMLCGGVGVDTKCAGLFFFSPPWICGVFMYEFFVRDSEFGFFFSLSPCTKMRVFWYGAGFICEFGV